jgi:hypothetical protein
VIAGTAMGVGGAVGGVVGVTVAPIVIFDVATAWRPVDSWWLAGLNTVMATTALTATNAASNFRLFPIRAFTVSTSHFRR